MNKQNLVIYDYDILHNILFEIKENFQFNLINVKKNKLSSLDLSSLGDYIILTSKENTDIARSIFIEFQPIKIEKLIQNINISFLKKKFSDQSEINVGNYKLNLNSRLLTDETNELDLTEKEAKIILFLSNSGKSVSIDQLQKKVWGHHSKLETHTVETHIYRLRKKISEKFKDNVFIKSSKTGYKIN